MTQEISALVDGEIDAADLDGIIKTCHHSEQNKHAWRSYHLIGEALRAENGHVAGLEQRILAQLQNEPTILAPRRSTWVPAFPRIALAVAASLATISAVTWLAFQQTPVAQPQVAAIPPAPVSQPVTPRVDDFVLAHREFTAAPDALIPASFGVNGNGDGSR